MDGHDTTPSRSSSGTNREDDLEMSDMNSIQRERDSSPRMSTFDHLEGDSDDDDQELDQSNQALLRPRERTRSREQNLEGPVKTWPQIRAIVLETGPTLLLTTVSILFTGKLLDRVSHWRAMKQVDELIIIIPVILNLKGNLEMNLSARLGTAANVGELDKPEVQRSVIYGNLLLLQVQATVVSFVATCVSFIIGLAVPDPVPLGQLVKYSPRPHRPHIPVKDGGQKSGFREFIMVASTSMSAACLSSLFLGSFMCFLVLLCRRFGHDPDNIAPPIASCLGDLVTLSFIGLVSTLLIGVINTPIPAVLGILVVLCAVTCWTFTLRNPSVRSLLRQGWSPLFGAMVIEVGTGTVLDLFVNRYDGFAVLAVAITSLPGNVGSILVSRLSTALHAAALSISPTRTPSETPMGGPKEPSAKLVMITLMLVTLPVEIIFLVVLHVLGWVKLPYLFIVFATLFFCWAVVLSLLFARALTYFLWSKGLDPDIYALPVQSALMDLIGQLLLVGCFELVSALGVRVHHISAT